MTPRRYSRRCGSGEGRNLERWAARLPDSGEVREAAAELEELGYSALFVPGRRGWRRSLHQDRRRSLAATTAVPVVTGILNVWMHEPAETCHPVRRARASPPRAVSARASGSATRRSSIATSPGATAGRSRRCVGTSTSSATASRVADAARGAGAEDARARPGAHRRLPSLLRSGRAHPVRPSGARAGRRRSPSSRPCCSRPIRRRPREPSREFMATYVGFPNYVNNLLRHGFTEARPRRTGAATASSTRSSPGATSEAIADRIAAHHEAGADHVCIQVLGPCCAGNGARGVAAPRAALLAAIRPTVCLTSKRPGAYRGAREWPTGIMSSTSS